MGYQPHHLLQFGGNLGTGDGDIWSCGIRLVISGGLPGDTLDHEQYLDDTAVPALVDWFHGDDAAISLYARLTWAKCNEIGEDGRYADPVTVHERFFAPIQGVSSIAPHPYQVSVAYTWHTDAASRGPGSRGRIYVPMPTGAINGDTGLFTDGLADQYARAARDLINSLDAGLGVVGGGTIRPCIASKVGDGTCYEINRVSVDNRYDIQRRRANAMDPTRQYEEVLY